MAIKILKFILVFPTYTTHPVTCNDQPGWG